MSNNFKRIINCQTGWIQCHLGRDIVKHKTNPPIIEGLAVSPLVKAKACCFPSLIYYTSVFYPSSTTGTLLPPLVSLPQEPFFFHGTLFLQLESVLYYCYSCSTTGTLSLALVPYLYRTWAFPPALVYFLYHCYASFTTATRPPSLEPVLFHRYLTTGTFPILFTVSVLLEPFLQHW